MKKFLVTLLTLVFALAASALVFSGCGEKTPPPDEGNKPIVTEPDPKKVDETISDASLVVDLTGGKKLYLTTIGQAADYDSVVNLLKANKPQGVGLAEGTDFTTDKQLTATAVNAGDTVVIVAGVSSKGMGAAGIDAASELNRAKAFAANTQINIIMVQAGGEARRGADSDPIFEVLGKVAKVSLVIESADKDNKFSGDWCKDTPLYLYTRTSKMAESFRFIFGK